MMLGSVSKTALRGAIGALALAALAGCGDTSADEALFGGGSGAATTGAGGASSGAGQGGATSTTTGQGGASSGEGGAGTTTSGEGGATSSTAAGASCGNGAIDPGEECDGDDLGGKTCVDLGYSSPAGLACAGCLLDSSGCMPTCDGAELEPGEQCDGAHLGGKTCADYGYVNPAGLACAGDCQGFDASGCSASCNGVLEPGEECDGADLDGHSCTDLGYVNGAGLKCTGCALDGSGCAAVCSNSVVEPGEECDDGNQTNGDGCNAKCQLEKSGTTCGNAIDVALSPGTTTLTGSTNGGGSHGAGCASDGSDRIYAVTPSASGFLTASLTRGPTSYDSVLYVASSCADQVQEILCADSYDAQNNTALDGGEVLSIPVQQGQTYYLFVDGYSNVDAGDYQLVLDLSGGHDCNDPVPIPLAPGSAMTLLGSNQGNSPNVQGSCGGQPGDEVVYAVTRSDAGPLGVATDSNYTDYNSVLYARSTCWSWQSQLACSNNQGNAMESIDLSLQAGAAVYVWVDGSTAGGGNAMGNYGLVLTP